MTLSFVPGFMVEVIECELLFLSNKLVHISSLAVTKQMYLLCYSISFTPIFLTLLLGIAGPGLNWLDPGPDIALVLVIYQQSFLFPIVCGIPVFSLSLGDNLSPALLLPLQTPR